MTGDPPDTPRNPPGPAPAPGDAQTAILEELRRLSRAQERLEGRFDDRLNRLERRLDDFESIADGLSQDDGAGPPPPAPRPVPPIGPPGSLEGVTAGAPSGAPSGAEAAPTPTPAGGGGEPGPRLGRDGESLQAPAAPRRTRRRGGATLAWLIVLVAVLAGVGWWAQTTGNLQPWVAEVRGLVMQVAGRVDPAVEEAEPVGAVPPAEVDSLAADDPTEGATPDPTPSDRVGQVVADIAEDRAARPVDGDTAGGAGSDGAADDAAAVDGETGAAESVAGDPATDAADGEAATATDADTDATADAGAADGADPAAAAATADGGDTAAATADADDAGEAAIGPEDTASAGDAGAPAGDAAETTADAAASADTAEAPAAQPDLDATPPAAAPEPPPGAPEVAAVPPEPVESADLEAVAADRAPLPDDASAELRELAQLAVDGRAEAQHDLATAYALGRGVPRDYELAAYWYRRSADSGVANALYNLGVLTQRGRGVDQDSTVAFDYFLAAAEEGHPDAQNAVGLAYANGRGVEADPLKAASWFQAASAAGNPRGAYHLGRLFEAGLDGAPDRDAAAGWYRIAAEAGDEDAQAALDRIAGAPAPATDAGVEVPVPDSAPEPVASGPTAPPEDTALTREDIREIQQRLEEAGFDPGPVDGLMGSQTRNAIEDWQQANGLPRTGEPSRRMLEMLRSAG